MSDITHEHDFLNIDEYEHDHEHYYEHGQQGHEHHHVHGHHAHHDHSPVNPEYEHYHAHEHRHSHANKKQVSNRLARAIGHLEKVKDMVDHDADCAEVLIQLSAVRSAINNVGKVILMEHLNQCIVDAVDDQDYEAIKEFGKAIQTFVK